MRLLLASILLGFGLATSAEQPRTPAPIPEAVRAAPQDEQPDQTPPVSRLESFDRLQKRLDERKRQESRLLEQENKALLAPLGVTLKTVAPGTDKPVPKRGAKPPGTGERPDNTGVKPAFKDSAGAKKLADAVDQGCNDIDCLKLEGLFTIKKVEGKVKPGAAIVLHGTFGKLPSQVVLLYKNWKKESKLEALSHLSWSNDTVAVSIPLWMEGFEDQLAELQVRRFELKGPNFPVSLKAIVEHRVLGYPDFSSKVVSCGTDANINCCNGQKDTDDPLYTAGPGYGACPVQASVTISGAHRNAWGAVGDDEGADRYSIKLQNGWIMTDVEIDAKPPCCKTASSAAGYMCWNNDCVDQPTPAFSPGATHWTPRFHWIVSPADTIYYDASVAIAGPKGVPHY